VIVGVGVNEVREVLRLWRVEESDSVVSAAPSLRPFDFAQGRAEGVFDVVLVGTAEAVPLSKTVFSASCESVLLKQAVFF
jgi:hypothetical protein